MIRFENVWKVYGNYAAIYDLQLEVRDGEFMVFVGPSGCGKTTTLKMLAGLELPSFGRIWSDDKDITLLPSGQRDVAMVFQSYALYPHMTVERNLAFGPTVRGEPKAEIADRVKHVASLVGLETLLRRRPDELSGGQRQRVALGRAMIRQPRIFLLDEPLSNLDAGLRTRMRAEIAELQRRVGVTTVYVTHDQVEAMTMGHRIAVFNQGRILQVDTPANLYRAPANKFVGTFIGSPKMNILPAALSATGGAVDVKCLGTEFSVSGQYLADNDLPSSVELGIRPDDIHWTKDAPSRCTQKMQGIVSGVETTGSETFVLVNVRGTEVNSKFPSFAPIRIGQTVDLVFDPVDLHFFDAVTGNTLRKDLPGQSERSELRPTQPIN
ncbi:ABC transporter ATP-binding protein [Mesorhizobium sp. M2D.F.Ca.ET.185.01.1.1]|uniref:ABC transporter ATP-binding protein n=1 Tax=unclassified Mesorhizobium TaxID=325217 RepID=UPI000FCA0751|nr:MULTISPECIES: ABC transporter ATP-binding protein [unclassified Mesorhizobium]TGP77359.1 ABC transporter ATP-binding protein [bacterium M00.F.Ca.ET.227.01.1.1]TGP93153.1 ABC transporter ATP-binding protein [bacterium M00.F.Ca.ET.222.01.1.1]TGP96699.1 ABC transporter ATP-binding protein [bacterium M00.F.Ca.ET.221.01.1.1]TGT95883.1 ABC transporter ATP-binding protein [bacterium M00.F.Ca.ET.163.01.1.1]TGU18468.1 ABC transporter ATP-binding protein [bacterium M00.F.Ca.ET.156.01.1.1]TGU49911.1 